MVQHITLSVDLNFPLELGAVVYKVGRAQDQYFSLDTCECCGGVGTVEIKGKRYTCPVCRGIKDGRFDYSTSRYKVFKYRLKSIGISGEDVTWEGAKTQEFSPHFYRQVKLLFERCEKSPSDLEAKTIIVSDLFKKGETVTFDDWYEYEKMYASYEEAVGKADKLNARQAASLATYNKKHRTNFKFEKPEYDEA